MVPFTIKQCKWIDKNFRGYQNTKLGYVLLFQRFKKSHENDLFLTNSVLNTFVIPLK